MVYFLRVLNLVAFLVDGCLLRENNPGRLIEHFMYRHWKSNVAIIQEGPEPLPRCDHCGMHIPAARLIKHIWMEICNNSTEIRLIQGGV